MSGAGMVSKAQYGPQADAPSSRAADDRHGRRRSVGIRRNDQVISLKIRLHRFAGRHEGGIGIDSRLDLRGQGVSGSIGTRGQGYRAGGDPVHLDD